MRNDIHNVFIDHVDHTADDGYHHHHGSESRYDILYHKHDGGDDPLHDHQLDDYDYVYSTAYHNHRARVIDNQLVHNVDPYGHDNNDDDDRAA